MFDYIIILFALLILTSKNLQSFSEKLSETDKIVRTMVVESLGLEDYMDDHMDSTKYLIRVQKYDVPRTHETELGLIPHTDKSVITILFENEVNGLQVMTKDGEWIAAQPSPNSIIVMVGQSFHVSSSTSRRLDLYILYLTRFNS